jgi:DNA-binding GntR family transcriptional regulator
VTPDQSFSPALHERRTVADYVAETLRDAIIAGQFEDGEELNQVKLAEMFNVSRVPIREAMRRLEAEGLISAEAHRRAVVVGFDKDRIAEIFEIRAMLESFALQRAATKLDSAQIAELRRLCEEADEVEDHEEWLEHNHRFHQALLAPSGSTTALTLVEQLSRQVERYIRRSGRSLHRPREAGEEHRQLVNSLEEGNVDEAREILTRHIMHTHDGVLEALSQLEESAPLRARAGTQPVSARKS